MLLDIGLANAVMASVLAVLAAVASRYCRKPALVHALWLLVLLKLIVPPLWKVPVYDAFSRLLPSPAASSGLERVPVRLESQSPLAVRPIQSPIQSKAPLADIAVDTARQPAETDASAAMDNIQALPSASSDIWVPAQPTQVRRPALSVPEAIVAFWAGGSCLCIIIIINRLIRFRRLLRFATPAPAWVQRQSDALANRMGAACPGVWFVPGTVCPMLLALGGKARLLIPAALWERLDDRQQSALLVHELAHLRRGDHRVRLLELLVTVLYWWHPVAWWARREMREAEEQCCDAWVVWLMPGSARHYAAALLEAVEFVSHGVPQGIRARPAVPLLASGMGEFNRLRRRLVMIKTAQVTRRLTWAGLASVLGLAGFLLPLAPTWAQVAPPTPGDAPAAPTKEEWRVIEQLRAQNAPRFNDPRLSALRNQRESELQAARAEVQKLAAALQQAHERLAALERDLTKMDGDAFQPRTGMGGASNNFGGGFGGGFSGATSGGNNLGGGGVVYRSETLNVDPKAMGQSLSGYYSAFTKPMPSSGNNFAPGQAMGSVTVNPAQPQGYVVMRGPDGAQMTVPPGATSVIKAPDGKIIANYTNSNHLPPLPQAASLEDRLSKLDAQLQQLREQVRQLRMAIHPDKISDPNVKPSPEQYRSAPQAR